MWDRPVTILVVEDDLGIHEVLAEVLRDEGYSTLSAYDGSQALQLAREKAVDLILLDLAIPGLPGVDVIRALRADELTATTPIVVTSGFEGRLSPEDQRLVQGVLPKPFSLDDLLALVARALDQRA
jgi:CheY-like chemotaxis protein